MNILPNRRKKVAAMLMMIIAIWLISCLTTSSSLDVSTIPLDAVVFSATDADSEGAIYIARTANDNIEPVISNLPSSAGVDCPSISPNRKEVAFFKEMSIFIMNSDGSNIRRVTDQGVGGCPIWSSDGTFIGFHNQIQNENGELIDKINALNLATGEVITLPEKANNWFSRFTWIPQTHKIVYTIGEQISYGGLYEYNLADNQGRTILDNPNVVEAEPFISPDGTKIVYQEVTFSGNSYQNVFIANFTKDGISSPKSIVQTKLGASGNQFATTCCISWSPNSEYFVIQLSTMNNSEMYVYNNDGQLKNQLTDTSEWLEGVPAWTSNGKYIVLTRFPVDMTHALNQLIAINFDNGSEKILVSEPDMSFSWVNP